MCVCVQRCTHGWYSASAIAEAVSEAYRHISQSPRGSLLDMVLSVTPNADSRERLLLCLQRSSSIMGSMLRASCWGEAESTLFEADTRAKRTTVQ